MDTSGIMNTCCRRMFLMYNGLKTNMAVIEVQLGLPSETSKKKGSNLTAVLRGNPSHRGDFEI